VLSNYISANGKVTEKHLKRKKLKNRRYITIGDIARKLEVSKVTVSKALRGHPDISDETAKLIKKTAEELGYTPNFAARRLSSRKSNAIGVVVPKIAHFYFSAVIEAIYDTAFKNGYDIALTVSQENPERERKHIETLLAMRVDGMIISITQDTRDKSIFRKVLDLNIPIVFMDRVIDLKGTSQVTVDDYGGALRAVKHAIEMGYRKIGYIGGCKRINIGKKRYAGYVDALRESGMEPNPDWEFFGGFGDETGYEGLRKMYSGSGIPEFIFTATYPIALGVLSACSELHIRVPDELDLISFGGGSIGKFVKPEISYVNQSPESIGKLSTELVIEHIQEQGKFKPRHIQIPTELVWRDTAIIKRVDVALKEG